MGLDALHHHITAINMWTGILTGVLIGARRSIALTRPRSLAQLERYADGRADAHANSDPNGYLINGDSNADAYGDPDADAEGQEAPASPVFVGGGLIRRHFALLP